MAQKRPVVWIVDHIHMCCFLFISYLIYFLRATVVWFPVLSVHMVSKANRLPMLCAWGTEHRINLPPSSWKKRSKLCFLQGARLFTYTPSIIHQWFSRYFYCQTVITERRWTCSSFYTWLIQQTTTQSRYRRRSKKNEKWPELRGKKEKNPERQLMNAWEDGLRQRDTED